MPRIVGFGKYSAAGAAGVLANGFTSRKETLAVMAGDLGGSQVGYWVVSDNRWDFMFMWDLPDNMMNTARAAFLAAQATGGFDNSEIFVLIETEVIDDSRSGIPGYQPPNQ